MRTKLKRLLLMSTIGLALAVSPCLWGADGQTPPPSKPGVKTKETATKPKAKRDWYPFGGFVSSVDTQARTVSLKKKTGERVLRLDAVSQLEVDGKPANLDRIRIGDYAHGKLHKDPAGREVITAAKFDRTPPKKSKAAASKDSQQ